MRNQGIRIVFILLLQHNEQKSGQYTNCYILFLHEDDGMIGWVNTVGGPDNLPL